jgi:hypothetical protein
MPIRRGSDRCASASSAARTFQFLLELPLTSAPSDSGSGSFARLCASSTHDAYRIARFGSPRVQTDAQTEIKRSLEV